MLLSNVIRTMFLPKQIHLKGEWKVDFSGLSYPHCTKTLLKEKLGEKILRKKRKLHNEAGFNPSIVDSVVSVNDRAQKRIGAQKH